MGILGGVGKLNFLTRLLWGFNSEQKRVWDARAHTHKYILTCTVSIQTYHIHTSRPFSLHTRTQTHRHTHPHTLFSHSCTHREAAYALSFSWCLEGKGNCCGSQATEHQPSVWLIGISGRRSVEPMESKAELLTNLEHFSTFFFLPWFWLFSPPTAWARTTPGFLVTVGHS